MAGKQQPAKSEIDDFTAGQMVGMISVLTFIDNNGDLSDEARQKLKQKAAESLEDYFGQPAEDIFLVVDTVMERRSK